MLPVAILINITIEYLQSLALQDNIWIIAEAANTAQQIRGVIQATQLLRAHRVLQEKG